MNEVAQGADRQRWNIQGAVASQILDFIRAHNLADGAHLSELRLSESLGVSRSPVRRALELLSNKGLLSREPNRGYFLSVDASTLADLADELPKSDEEELYRRIVAARLEGRVGEQMTETDLVRTHNVGRALLVRVLSRMVEDGVVQRARGQGWRFMPALLTEDAHDESYRFRLLIEPAGMRESTFARQPERLASLRAQHERLFANAEAVRAAEFIQINADFHEMVAAFSNNRYILQAVQHQNRLRRLIEVKGASNVERIRVSCLEHLEMIAAIERGDTELAAVLMTSHLAMASRLKLAFAPSTHSPADGGQPMAVPVRAVPPGETGSPPRRSVRQSARRSEDPRPRTTARS